MFILASYVSVCVCVCVCVLMQTCVLTCFCLLHTNAKAKTMEIALASDPRGMGEPRLSCHWGLGGKAIKAYSLECATSTSNKGNLLSNFSST